MTVDMYTLCEECIDESVPIVSFYSLHLISAPLHLEARCAHILNPLSLPILQLSLTLSTHILNPLSLPILQLSLTLSTHILNPLSLPILQHSLTQPSYHRHIISNSPTQSNNHNLRIADSYPSTHLLTHSLTKCNTHTHTHTLLRSGPCTPCERTRGGISTGERTLQHGVFPLGRPFLGRS